jgi:hypothetical protein
MQTDTDRHHTLPTEDTRVAGPGTTLADETTRRDIRRHYPASAFRGPLFETRDRIALAMATVMLIGPLVALPLGF